MPARRCSICGTDWPLDDAYEMCPSPNCVGLKTDPVSNITPLPDAEALSMKNHFDFERFYEKWDESQPASRLSTEGMKEYLPEVPARKPVALLAAPSSVG